MNGAFVHLAINHIPVVGMPICFLILAGGTLSKSRDLIQAGLLGLVLVGIITIPVWKTGGPAAGVVKGYPGITREQIHEHAEAGETGAIIAGILGVIALAGWWRSRRPEGAPKFLVTLALLGSLGASVWMGYVAHLGGEIRHPEMEAAKTPAPAPPAQ